MLQPEHCIDMGQMSVRFEKETLREIEELRESISELSEVNKAEFICRGASIALDLTLLEKGMKDRAIQIVAEEINKTKSHVSSNEELLALVAKCLLEMYLLSLLDSLVQTLYKGPHAGGFSTSYSETFKMFLTELANSKIKDEDVLEIRVENEVKEEKIEEFVEKVVTEITSFSKLVERRRK